MLLLFLGRAAPPVSHPPPTNPGPVIGSTPVSSGIDLTAARAAIRDTFLTNACTIQRPTITNDNGIAKPVYTTIATTTCSIAENRATGPQPADDKDLGERGAYSITMPTSIAELRKGDRIITLGRTFRVVFVPPLKAFRLSNRVGVVEDGA